MPELEETIYRVVQESLTNAVKHADASQVIVVVGETPQAITLTVGDDGCGFDAAEHVDGFGLLGMGERIGLADGHLDVQSQPGTGTVITVELPPQRRELPATASG